MVYAVIQSGGKQHRVSVGDRIDVEKLPQEVGQTVEIDQVLAVGEGADLQVGAPTVKGAKVVCEVVRQDRARKILVGKYKKRKNYYRKKGHRQHFTRLKVDSIVAKGLKAKTKAKAKAPAEVEPVATETPEEEQS